ncbi:MAG TPA: outer membrane lipoprotein-sorting protein [Bdellovibrionota bacterium]|jgi:outer membrane lipoprotein-sorting protein|nr:outer membrane lipoprotein-sorting protein [Bdellovibrionota bacterium]
MKKILALALISAVAQAAPLNPQQTAELIKLVDDRQRNSGDYQSVAYIRETEKKKEPKVFQAVVYRRDADDKFIILFTKPKEEAGKGYLKIDKNLWMFDPSTGKWERKTEREKIGGTNSRREDFDESRLSEDYDATYEGEGELGKFKAHKVRLTAKAGVKVAFENLLLWIDQADKNILKREESSKSGKLMRTAFYPRWIKKFSSSKKADVWIPEEIRIFDEIEKGNSTVVLIKETDLSSLDANLFTKAWIESKSK